MRRTAGAHPRPRTTRSGARAGTRPAAARRRAQAAALGASEAAWLASVPAAAIVLLAIVVLGPPLGDVLFAQQGVTFWPGATQLVHPEPTEQARFVIALTAPVLLAALTLVLLRRAPRAVPPAVTWTIEAAAAAFAVACLIVQRQFTFGRVYEGPGLSFHRVYFTSATLAVSVLGAVAVLAAARNSRLRERFEGWTRETRGRRIGAGSVAFLMIVIWLLHAFNTESTIADAHFAAAYHIQFTLDETFAVLDGRSPLVNFAAQYGFLWPYPVAAGMALLGTSIGVFSALMCTISGLALLAMYDALRRVARSAISALLLFGPFMATAFFMLRGPLTERYTYATIFSAYPMRFAGPWLLVWMTARHLGGARPRRAWPLFLVAGLVVMNNVDHGVPALLAVVAALLWTGGRPSGARLRTLALELAGGLLAAFALVSLLTLLREGSLPHLALLLRFARLFASAGFAMIPMPTLGFHTVIYLTFVAAIATATVRAIDDHPDRILTGLLAWSGVFGLAAGSYYVGRSHPEVLVDAFGTWAFTIALLLVVVLRRIAVRPSGWPTPAEAACVVAFGLAACSLAQTPAPWSQLQRLQHTTAKAFDPPPGQSFVAAHVHRGESVVILMLLGHRMADNLGIRDVAPYTGGRSMPAIEQLDETIRQLRDEGARKLFVNRQESFAGMLVRLEELGFTRTAHESNGIELWVDGRRRG